MYWYKVWKKMAPSMTWYNIVPMDFEEVHETFKEDSLTITSPDHIPSIVFKGYDGWEPWPHVFGQD